MRDVLKRYGLIVAALWAGLGEMARAVRIEPWSFHVCFVHVHPFPIDIRFRDSGFDLCAFALGLAMLSGGVALHYWQAARRQGVS